MSKKFYVYALLDPRKPGKYIYGEYEFDYEPFYIGKGCGNRINAHTQPASLSTTSIKNSKINKIIKEDYKIVSIKIKSSLSESNALLLEKTIINEIGRYDLKEGVLTNMSDGGELGHNQNRDKFKVKIDRISMYDETNYITYDSIKEACLYNNINNKGNIVSCCRGKILHYKGYIWQYSDSKKRSEFSKIRNKLLDKYKVIQHLEDSPDIIFNSIKEASEFNNVTSTCVIYSCQGKTGKNSKYNFEYYSIDKKLKYKKQRCERYKPNGKEIPIIQLDLNMNFIKEWTSANSAGKELKYNASSITACCRGRQKNSYNFIWLYKKDYKFNI